MKKRVRPCQGKVGTRIFRRFKAGTELSLRTGDEWGAKEARRAGGAAAVGGAEPRQARRRRAALRAVSRIFCGFGEGQKGAGRGRPGFGLLG